MKKLSNEELNRLTVDQFKQTIKYPIVIVLDNVRSLNNIGSVFRTSDAFLVMEIALCGFTATPPHRDIHKTALGATESVDWKYFNSTKEAVIHYRNLGFLIVSIEQADNSKSLKTFDIDEDKKYALIFGNEVQGVEQEIVDLSDEVIELPQLGTKHSLNISVCAGILIWEFFKKFNK